MYIACISCENDHIVGNYIDGLGGFTIKLPLFHHRLKDFVFVIFQMKNLNGINLSEIYWIIQIMIIFMVVVVVFHICM
jgi:hypothetical protein